jgi:hypothetical protein
MGTRTVYRTNYSFEKPKPLSELEFAKVSKTIPSYPLEDNVMELVFKKYWFNVIFAIIFPPSIILSTEFIEYYQVLKKKNRILFEYYDVIYNSKDYNDYLKKYELIK